MTNHITASEWRDYFARGRMTADRLRLFSRVHAHLGSCAECRALHQRLSESNDALRQLLSAQSAPEQAAFLAVGAALGGFEGIKPLHGFFIDIQQPHIPKVRADVLFQIVEIAGIFRRYAGPLRWIYDAEAV